MNKTRIILTIAILLSIFSGAFATGKATASYPVVTLGGYEVRLVGSVVSGQTSTWTYAVTATSALTNGLSHITFGVEFPCGYTVTAPPTGSYTTRIDVPYCSEPGVNCQVASYFVEIGKDPTTGVSGVKFNAISNMLDIGNLKTHIFQITLLKTSEGDTILGTVPLGLKAGTQNLTSPVAGAVCKPTAVTLSGLGAASTGASMLAVVLPAAPLVLGLAALRLRRKRL
jgi:hypothetical protein